MTPPLRTPPIPPPKPPPKSSAAPSLNNCKRLPTVERSRVLDIQLAQAAHRPADLRALQIADAPLFTTFRAQSRNRAPHLELKARCLLLILYAADGALTSSLRANVSPKPPASNSNLS
eukprot:5159444-Pleurochrysis_carterae.AAC.1